MSSSGHRSTTIIPPFFIFPRSRDGRPYNCSVTCTAWWRVRPGHERVLSLHDSFTSPFQSSQELEMAGHLINNGLWAWTCTHESACQ